MIHVAGDNDIGGEWMDSITQNLVSRFSQYFGSINEIIELKTFQIVKVRKPISKIKKDSLAYRDWLISRHLFIISMQSLIGRSRQVWQLYGGDNNN